jgi:protease I
MEVPMPLSLNGRKVAILVADGFEQVELTGPRKALERAGAATDIVSPEEGAVRSWRHGRWGKEFPVDCALADANPNDYDALLLPGGVMNPDRLRTIPEAIQFIQHFALQEKPIAAICHGPWTLVEADAVQGKTLTSWPSLKTDIRNAGGKWADQPVVYDRGILTSRKPEDIPAFNARMIQEFGKGARQAATVSRPRSRKRANPQVHAR